MAWPTPRPASRSTGSGRSAWRTRAADARAILSQRRAVLDDVKTIAAYALDMSEFLNESELTERRAFIETFVKEIVVMPGDALLRYTIPISQSTPKTAVLVGDRPEPSWRWHNLRFPYGSGSVLNRIYTGCRSTPAWLARTGGTTCEAVVSREAGGYCHRLRIAQGGSFAILSPFEDVPYGEPYEDQRDPPIPCCRVDQSFDEICPQVDRRSY